MRREQSGFTLLELMIGAALASIVMGAIFGLMRGQITGLADQNRSGEMQDHARLAMDIIGKRVGRAGFGLPADRVFGPITQALNNAPGGDAMGTCPGTDVIETRARSPVGTWINSAAGTSSGTWTGLPAPALGMLPPMSSDIAWPAGTRLLLIPAPGRGVMVRTSARRAAGANNVGLDGAESAELGVAGNNVDGAETYVVETSRFRVTCANPSQPTLVLETDTDVNNDNVVDVKDQQPIATDVEDLQLAYLLDRDADGQVSSADAVNWASTLTSAQQASIKAIRVTLVARSAQPFKAQGTTVSAPFTIEDHTPAAPSPTQLLYGRRRVSETIYLDNRDTTEPLSFSHISNRWL